MTIFKQRHKIKANVLFVIFVLLASQSALANSKILVWGDSLSAAYGIPVEKGWVHLLQQELGDDHKIINGSISGETTQGGLTRLPVTLKKHKPDTVIIELGANDGLRGFPPQVTKNNLKKMIQLVLSQNARVVLLGMRIPPNFGKSYSDKFESLFAELADEFNLPFIPFFLEEVAGDLDYFLADGLHPTAEAQPIILKSILPAIRSTLSAEQPRAFSKNPA